MGRRFKLWGSVPPRRQGGCCEGFGTHQCSRAHARQGTTATALAGFALTEPEDLEAAGVGRDGLAHELEHLFHVGQERVAVRARRVAGAVAGADAGQVSMALRGVGDVEVAPWCKNTVRFRDLLDPVGAHEGEAEDGNVVVGVLGVDLGR